MEEQKEKIARNFLGDIRPAIPFLLVIGLLLGPVYYAYCLFYSGKTSQTIEMTERASRWVTPDGSILRFPNGMAYKPIALALSPDMNRISLRINFSNPKNGDTNRPSNLQYQASLFQLDHTILKRPIELEFDEDDVQVMNIGPLEIPYPAEYLFVLEQIGNDNLSLQLSLEVIEKIETPARTILWTGMALLMIAAALAVYDVVKAVRSSRTR